MDMFTTRTMLGMIEAGKKSNHTWLRDRYFAYRPTFNTQKIDFDIVGMGGRKIVRQPEGRRHRARARRLCDVQLRSAGTLSDARHDC